MIRKAIISLAVWFVAQLIVMGIALLITKDESTSMIAGLFGGAVITIFFLALIKYYKFSDLVKPVPFIVWLASIPLVFSTLFAINILSSIVEIPDLLTDEFEVLSSSIIGIIAIAVVGPIQEEIIMRRVIMKSIYDQKKKVWLAIIISSVVFAVIHGNPIQMVFALPAGILLGWLYYRTGSLLVPITGHIVNNSFSCVDTRTKLTESIYGADATLSQPSVAITFAICIIIAAVLIVWLNNYCKTHSDFLPLQPESQDDLNFEVSSTTENQDNTPNTLKYRKED